MEGVAASPSSRSHRPQTTHHVQCRQADCRAPSATQVTDLAVAWGAQEATRVVSLSGRPCSVVACEHASRSPATYLYVVCRLCLRATVLPARALSSVCRHRQPHEVLKECY